MVIFPALIRQENSLRSLRSRLWTNDIHFTSHIFISSDLILSSHQTGTSLAAGTYAAPFLTDVCLTFLSLQVNDKTEPKWDRTSLRSHNLQPSYLTSGYTKPNQLIQR